MGCKPQTLFSRKMFWEVYLKLTCGYTDKSPFQISEFLLWNSVFLLQKESCPFVLKRLTFVLDSDNIWKYYLHKTRILYTRFDFHCYGKHIWKRSFNSLYEQEEWSQMQNQFQCTMHVQRSCEGGKTMFNLWHIVTSQWLTSVHDLVFLPQVGETFNDLERQIFHEKDTDYLLLQKQ